MPTLLSANTTQCQHYLVTSRSDAVILVAVPWCVHTTECQHYLVTSRSDAVILVAMQDGYCHARRELGYAQLTPAPYELSQTEML